MIQQAPCTQMTLGFLTQLQPFDRECSELELKRTGK